MAKSVANGNRKTHSPNQQQEISIICLFKIDLISGLVAAGRLGLPATSAASSKGTRAFSHQDMVSEACPIPVTTKSFSQSTTLLLDIQKAFTALGGEFLQPLTTVTRKQQGCKGYLFDWDGVFNQGHKTSTSSGSTFSEVDAMGINMLRFSTWLRTQRIPLIGIVTGELNPAAASLALRDHFDFVFYKVNHKTVALDWINQELKLTDYHLGFVFDDVLDLGVASRVNLRVAIRRPATPLFREMLKQRNYADYITANTGQDHAVREMCELFISFNGNYTETMERRVRYQGDYDKYLQARNAITTRFMTLQDGAMVDAPAPTV